MSREQLPKVYDPKIVETKWYEHWMKHGFFHARAESPKPKYTIVIPPPNVTGMLTMGHILNNTLQDLLIRWKRMEGFEVLWLPGMDHAGIATQNKVEAAIKEEGLTRHDLGREELIHRVWEWKDKYGGIILRQLHKLGASCDWSRERFTMDEGLSRAVREVFIRLFEKGWIVKGRRLINWCPRCQTALANEEVPATEKDGFFWHIAYPLSEGGGDIVVSTTRPETMLGDTAVAVHPEDKRYTRFVGKTVILPLMDRPIPIIADPHADPEKGSGAVKITPAHDFNDFEVGSRHNLPVISVIDERGRMSETAGRYRGLDRFEARKKILADLETLGLLRGKEPRRSPIPHCYRCQTAVEPYLSEQWFVRMKELVGPAIAAVREGKIRFYPKHWEETYFHWMENIQDWCISRQIWWGHRIPVWTCGNGHVFTSRDNPSICPSCKDSQLTQDPDVLDTWFSSWLWPFSTLGWPDKTGDLKVFFPTDTLVTGPDIIFFWVARMIMASLEFMRDVPFRDVYFNGMIRDLAGRKMSKSLGNSPDPLWLIEGADKTVVKEFSKKNPSYRDGVPAYGADAIRFTMVALTPLGGDIHFDHPLVELGQKFCNKLWNAARFLMMNCDDVSEGSDPAKLDSGSLDLADRWILSRLQSAVNDIQQQLTSFRFNDASRSLYAFVWGEFCDWYLELIKPRLFDSSRSASRHAAQTVALHVLDRAVRLLHPFMPFITEEIWQALPIRRFANEPEPSILFQPYPEAEFLWVDASVEETMSVLQRSIGAVRTIRSEMNVPPDRKARLLVRGTGHKVDLVKSFHEHFERLAAVDRVEEAETGTAYQETATALVDDLEILVPLEGLIDLKAEHGRVVEEISRLEQLLAGLNVKLNNPEFVRKAPSAVVEKERQKQKDFREKVEKLYQTRTALER